MLSASTKLVLWITSSTPTACEILASTSGADVILIDGQHGAFGPDEALKLVSACSMGKAQCAVRISDHNAVAEACRFLDAGATTIICPMINDKPSCIYRDAWILTEEETSPPLGNRSYGPYRHRLLFKDGFSPNKANAQVTTLAMIETKAAVQNLEEILAVENLSGVFIGPNDLGLSLGFQPSSSPRGEVLNTVLSIGETVRGKNKIAGIFCSDIETARDMAKAGFNFVVYGSDIGFSVAGSQSAVTKARL